jgi:putative oxidoreductase
MNIRNLLVSTHSMGAGWAALLLRLGAGFFMALHGWEKLINFNEKVTGWPDPLGVGDFASLSLTVFSELVCSVLVMLGLFTRPALAVLIITMLIIVFVVHAGDPLGDREHALLFLIPYVALFLLGPGRLSVDSLLKK